MSRGEITEPTSPAATADHTRSRESARLSTKQLLISIALSITGSFVSEQAFAQDCFASYNYTNDEIKHRYVLCRDNATHVDAAARARSLVKSDGAQGYLAIINSELENRRLKGWLSIPSVLEINPLDGTRPPSGQAGAFAWLGGKDADGQDHWRWERGTLEGGDFTAETFWQGDANGSGTGAYTNWGTVDGVQVEPTGVPTRNALAMALEDWVDSDGGGEAGQWNDQNELHEYYYIVEFDDPAAQNGDANLGGGNSNNSVFRVSLEEPVEGQTHMGVGNLRGWAVADAGIDKVDIYIDGSYAFNIPYGGYRGDVGGTFPDVADSQQSGFSAAFNYSGLTGGAHTVTAVAYAASGATEQSSATFNVVRFATEFISDPNAVRLNDAVCRVSGDEISLVDAVVSGEIYDLLLKWRPAEQGFEIIEIR